MVTRNGEDVEPVTDRTHDGSWSANLETDQYVADVDLLVEHAIDAVEHTRPGSHVNLVTHAEHGDPSEYLADPLETAFDDIEYEYVDQCGCGGHVFRVYRS
ncbi:CGCGG family rSAM-modified RiPP protein (plasmid) [Haloferacaceae archaeon DSL9]